MNNDIQNHVVKSLSTVIRKHMNDFLPHLLQLYMHAEQLLGDMIPARVTFYERSVILKYEILL